MIHKLHIKNFKLIKDSSFNFKPLTIITGTNSCGKSSILQTLCFFINTNIENIEKSMYIQNFTRNLYIFDQMRNKDLHEALIHIALNEKNIINITKEEIIKDAEYLFDFEEDFYYLKSNRNLIQDTEKIQNNIKFGVSGEYIGNYFSTNSLKSIDDIFYENPDSNKILNYHVDKWIKEILDLEISFTTNESIDIIINGFKDKNFSNYFLPSNISTGLNFATKIIIIGLSLKKGDIFIIENPEIHLHPKAISKFADFFAFLVSKGIQVIIETHSNYLLSKLRYINFKKEFKDEDCIIYYKDQQTDFVPIFIHSGKFTNINREKINFPTGFFDTDLDKLMEIR